MLAFAVSRFSFKSNIPLLMLFTAGNLLPQQVIITPLFRMYLPLPLLQFAERQRLVYDSVLRHRPDPHRRSRLGFCTFVLSNYMKTISKELTEAALVDGASLWTTYRRVILPLSDPRWRRSRRSSSRSSTTTSSGP